MWILLITVQWQVGGTHLIIRYLEQVTFKCFFPSEVNVMSADKRVFVFLTVH